MYDDELVAVNFLGLERHTSAQQLAQMGVKSLASFLYQCSAAACAATPFPFRYYLDTLP
jgi:hypothetical protein